MHIKTHKTPVHHDLRDHGTQGFCTRVEDIKGCGVRKPSNGLRSELYVDSYVALFDNENHYQ